MEVPARLVGYHNTYGMEEMEIRISDEEVAEEVALGIIGRAGDLHENPDDSTEEVALELREVGHLLEGVAYTSTRKRAARIRTMANTPTKRMSASISNTDAIVIIRISTPS